MTLKKGLPFPLREAHEMATKQASFICVDEDFFDLELSSTNAVSRPISPPSQSREFEFPTSSVSHEKESPPSLADDLFYNGKLLPLHLLNNSNAISDQSARTHSDLTDYRFPSPSSRPSISPSELSMATSGLRPYKFLSVLPSKINDFARDPPKKSWSNKLKQIKQLTLGQRLKASRAYAQSLFRKYDCSDKSCVPASNNAVAEKKSKNPSEIMKTTSRELIKEGGDAHGRSFSGVSRHSGTKSSPLMSKSSVGSLSSSFSLSSSSRSSSVNSELESSIEGAIAHCKQSQQLCASTEIPDDVRT